jgi:hypothetical protein
MACPCASALIAKEPRYDNVLAGMALLRADKRGHEIGAAAVGQLGGWAYQRRREHHARPSRAIRAERDGRQRP